MQNRKRDIQIIVHVTEQEQHLIAEKMAQIREVREDVFFQLIAHNARSPLSWCRSLLMVPFTSSVKAAVRASTSFALKKTRYFGGVTLLSRLMAKSTPYLRAVLFLPGLFSLGGGLLSLLPGHVVAHNVVIVQQE